MSDRGNGNDRRVRRTKDAIQSAFSHLALSREFDRIHIGDILSAADVARSTFYQHFSGKDDVLRSVLSPILEPLAQAGSEADTGRLVPVAEHLWQNRRLAKAILAGSARNAIARDLSDRIEQALRDARPAPALPIAYVARIVAQWQVACLDEWLTGRHRCDAQSWALAMCRGTSGLTTALTGIADDV